MLTLVRKTDTEISSGLLSALKKYKKYFSSVLISSAMSDSEALLEYKEALSKTESFFYFIDNFKLKTFAWSNIIVQSILKAPIVFVSKYPYTRNIIYLNKYSFQLREVIEKPNFNASTGIYILNPEVYNFIEQSSDIDLIIKSWAKVNRKKARGSREKSNILVFPIEGWSPNDRRRTNQRVNH